MNSTIRLTHVQRYRVSSDASNDGQHQDFAQSARQVQRLLLIRVFMSDHVVILETSDVLVGEFLYSHLMVLVWMAWPAARTVIVHCLPWRPQRDRKSVV